MDILLFLFWMSVLCAQKFSCAPDVPWCPVAEENKQYELNCTTDKYNVLSPKQKFIIWRMNSSSDISTCALTESQCQTNKLDKSVRIVLSKSENPVFNLKFLKVTAKDRNTMITCLLWDMKIDEKTELRSCQMAVHRPATAVNCTFQTSNFTELNCIIFNVFPGVTCQFHEMLNDEIKKYNISMNTTYDQLDKNDPQLYNSSCVTKVYHTQTGNYKYQISYKLNYPNTETLFQADTSRVINITHIPTVKVTQIESALCPEKTNIKLMCEALGFHLKPVFKLFIGTQEITAHEYGDNFTKYQVDVNSSFQRKLIRCSADYEDNPLQDFLINDTKYLDLKWPPPTPPYFIDGKFKTKLGEIIEISRGGDLSVICLAPGGTPAVSLIRVQCWSNRTLRLNQSSETGNVSFTLFGNDTFQIQACLCSALQPVTCYNATSLIFFFVKSFNGKTGSVSWDMTINRMTPMYYIIAVTLFLLFLPIILGTCIFISRKGEDLYSDYYHFFKRTPSTRHTNSSNPPLPPPRLPPPRYLIPDPVLPTTVAPRPGDESDEWKEDHTFLSQFLAPLPPQQGSSVTTDNDDCDYLMPCVATRFLSLPQEIASSGENGVHLSNEAFMSLGEIPPRSLGFQPPLPRRRPQLQPERIQKKRKKNIRKKGPRSSNSVWSCDTHLKKDADHCDVTSDSSSAWLDTSLSELPNINRLVQQRNDAIAYGGTTQENINRATSSRQNEYNIDSDVTNEREISFHDSDSDILTDMAELNCYHGSPKLPPRQHNGENMSLRTTSRPSGEASVENRQDVSSNFSPREFKFDVNSDVHFLYNDDDRLDIQSLYNDDDGLDLQPLYYSNLLETQLILNKVTSSRLGNSSW